MGALGGQAEAAKPGGERDGQARKVPIAIQNWVC